MLRLRATFALLGLLFVFFLLAIIPGCGSGNGVALITVAPSPPSVNFGEVLQLVPTAFNSKNNVLASATFTYSSSVPNTVSTTGQVCGGTWDANFIVCTAATASTQFSVTITSGSISFAALVYVHPPVTNVEILSPPANAQQIPPPTGQPIPPSPPTCISTNATEQFQACAVLQGAAACSLASSLGGVLGLNPVQWTSSDTSVVTIDSTATSTNGTATAVAPGSTTIIAALSGTSSTAIPFITCPITSVSVIGNSSFLTFNTGPGGTVTMEATATDSMGVIIPNPALSFLSTQPYVATVVGQTTTITTTIPPTTSSATSATTVTTTVPLPDGTVTTVKPGTASLVASCSPPTCNKNMFPVYSNPIVATTNGSSGTTVYAASTGSAVLLPINVSSNTLGTAIALTGIPNSFLFNHQGTTGVLGSSSGVMLFNPNATATTAFITQLPFNGDGNVLRISPDGTLAAVSGQVAGQVQNAIGIINLTNNSLTSLLIAGTATGADFTPDSKYLWVTTTPLSGSTAGPRLYMYSISQADSSFFPLTSPASDIAFLANGPVAYLIGDTAPDTITARATCNQYERINLPIDTQTGTAPSKVRALPNGTGAVALDLPNIDVITVNQPTLAGCPAAFPETLAPPTNLGQGSSLTPAQFLVTPDSSRAILTSNTGTVIVFNLSSATPSPIALGNGATAAFQGDVTADSTLFFVGGNDGSVHEISLTTGVDFLQIPTGAASGVNPDLVAVQNR